ncbi:MAG: HEPN domain-containing protein [Betaproteobacteria bacterium]
MSAGDANRKLAHSYLVKADQDLSALRYLAGITDVADEIVGFHAQQCVEKALKALLIWKGIPFRRTHDLAELLDLLIDHNIPLPEEIQDVDFLNPFAVEFRYAIFLSEEPPIDRTAVLRSAEAVRNWVRSLIGEC